MSRLTLRVGAKRSSIGGTRKAIGPPSHMIDRYPPLNGPYAVSRDRRTADYCIGRFLIYVAITFDKQATHEHAFDLAGKHRLGFYAQGETWLPGAIVSPFGSGA
jgi:hypothetical protein